MIDVADRRTVAVHFIRGSAEVLKDDQGGLLEPRAAFPERDEILTGEREDHGCDLRSQRSVAANDLLHEWRDPFLVHTLVLMLSGAGIYRTLSWRGSWRRRRRVSETLDGLTRGPGRAGRRRPWGRRRLLVAALVPVHAVSYERPGRSAVR
eukprot:5072762-Heterocapsa_arctica.AAC.1